MMTEWAQVRSGVVVNICVAESAEMAAIGGPWDAVIDLGVVEPRPGPGWGYAGGVFAPPPTYRRPVPGALGAFFEAVTEQGYQWVYIVGPVIFEAADATLASTSQPTVNAAKTYIATHGTDDQLLTALAWAVDYRDKLTAAITAAGGNPATNQRVTKLNAVINALGAAV